MRIFRHIFISRFALSHSNEWSALLSLMGLINCHCHRSSFNARWSYVFYRPSLSIICNLVYLFIHFYCCQLLACFTGRRANRATSTNKTHSYRHLRTVWLTGL